MKQSFDCAVCGASFERSASHVRGKHGAQFCSRACHYAGRRAGMSRRVVTEPYRYTPEGKAAMIAAARRPKGQRVNRLSFVCESCGKAFSLRPGDIRGRSVRFCSVQCIGVAQRGAGNPAWRGGYRPYYGPDWRPLQRAARKRDGYTCQRCGITQKELGRQLDVHHITPVSIFTEPNDANTLDNVVTLCHPCHMTAEWEQGIR